MGASIDWRDRADWWLAAWADWLGHDRQEINQMVGYPARSIGLECGGISGVDAFDHLVEWADMRCVKIIDAAVSQLDGQHYAAIHNRWLGSVWRYRGDPSEILKEATRRVWLFAGARGVV